MVLHQVTRFDHKRGDCRQRFIAEHVVEDRFEFRHNEDEEKTHDRHRHRHHDHRIDHRRDDLVFNLGGFLLKFR